MNIPTSDLRKGNIISTEYGILPIHNICFNDIQVKTSDGRILWVNRLEGIDLLEFEFQESTVNQISSLINKEFKRITDVDRSIVFVHELQNWYYWNSGKQELKIELSTDILYSEIFG